MLPFYMILADQGKARGCFTNTAVRQQPNKKDKQKLYVKIGPSDNLYLSHYFFIPCLSKEGGHIDRCLGVETKKVGLAENITY